MNTVKLSSLALLGALTLVACKEAPQEIQESETQTVINEQLAMTEDFKEAGEAFTTGSWLRLPAGSSSNATAGTEGAQVWIKRDHLGETPQPPQV